MKTFLAFLIKEFRHILRDRRSLIILFGLPVVQIILFGFALSNEVKQTNLAVWDQAGDERSRELITELEASRYFRVQDAVHSEADLERLFRRNQVRLVMIIPPNFDSDLEHLHRSVIQLIADASDTNTATTVVNYAQGIIRSFQDRLWGEITLPYAIHTEVRLMYNPQLKSAYAFVPGLIAMIVMLLSTMMTSVAIVREKENGNMEVLLVSPVKPTQVILTKALPYLLLSFINVILILVISHFLLEVPLHGQLTLFFGVSLIYILTSLALGLMISTVTNSQLVAMFLSMVGLMLPTLILSGFMFPIENMPKPLQIFSHVVPARWYYIIAQGVLIKGLGLSMVWKEIFILLGMTLVFLVISIRRFDLRLKV